MQFYELALLSTYNVLILDLDPVGPEVAAFAQLTQSLEKFSNEYMSKGEREGLAGMAEMESQKRKGLQRLFKCHPEVKLVGW